MNDSYFIFFGIVNAILTLLWIKEGRTGLVLLGAACTAWCWMRVLT